MFDKRQSTADNGTAEVRDLEMKTRKGGGEEFLFRYHDYMQYNSLKHTHPTNVYQGVTCRRELGRSLNRQG